LTFTIDKKSLEKQKMVKKKEYVKGVLTNCLTIKLFEKDAQSLR